MFQICHRAEPIFRRTTKYVAEPFVTSDMCAKAVCTAPKSAACVT